MIQLLVLIQASLFCYNLLINQQNFDITQNSKHDVRGLLFSSVFCHYESNIIWVFWGKTGDLKLTFGFRELMTNIFNNLTINKVIKQKNVYKKLDGNQ